MFFSVAVNAVFVAKLLISGVLFSTSVSFVFLKKNQLHEQFSFVILFCLFDV